MAGINELANLVARLEAVTGKLEGIATRGGDDDATSELYIK